VVCLDADSGKELWKKDVDPISILAKDQAESLRKDLAALVEQVKNAPNDKTLGKRISELTVKGAVDESLSYRDFMTLAPATPASDGKRVYVQFPAGVLAAYDLDGKEVWKIPAVPNGWIMGNSSPVVFKDRVLAICGSRNSPTLLCVDSSTGKENWKTTFPTADHCGAGSSAIVASNDGWKVVTPVFKIFDFQTGKEWRTHTYYTAIGATPITDGQKIFHVHGDYGCKERSLVMIDCSKPFTNPTDGITVILRKSSGNITGSPLLLGEKVYLPDGAGTTPEIINLSTGNSEAMVDKMLPLAKKGKSEFKNYSFYPSPALAGGKIFQVLDDGQVLILDQSSPTKVLATNTLAPTCGSPFFVGKRIYFRTRDGVCCIGE
jgi:outer membrane protein assembly factor BamB